MDIDVVVNNKTIQAKKGETILNLLNRHGISVPTLCKIEGFTPTGACRLCVVEVEGSSDLIPSCSFPIYESLKIKTHSTRVVKARKLVVELLLSNHPDDCLYCIRNGMCELQDLAEDLNVRERRIAGKKLQSNLDQSSPSIVRDPSKCVLCGRCVRVCEEKLGISTFEFIRRGNEAAIGTTMNNDLNFSNCIHCGQCLVVCPTAALYERTYLDRVQEVINNPDLTVVVQYSPSISSLLADEFELRSGKDMSELLNTALRKIGFDKVYTTAFSADLMFTEQAAELKERIDKGENLPMISSDCPGWIKYMTQSYPELIPHVSTCKSPQQIMGAMIKKYLSENENIKSDNVISVSIMPCTAKKFEAQLEEMTHKGVSDIDIVITTRELIKLIKLYGIDIHSLEPDVADEPFNVASTSAQMIAINGGISEGVIRTLHKSITGKDVKELKNGKLRTFKELKEATVKIGSKDFIAVAVSGLRNAQELLNSIKSGESKIDYLEISACSGGCLNGGGQPFTIDEKLERSRIKSIYSLDDRQGMKFPYDNQKLATFYKSYIGEPLCEEARKSYHTNYRQRDVLK